MLPLCFSVHTGRNFRYELQHSLDLDNVRRRAGLAGKHNIKVQVIYTTSLWLTTYVGLTLRYQDHVSQE